MAKLKYLFQPLKIGRMEVKNRIVMPAMDVSFGIDEEGCVTPQLTEYFIERARSGPGMILAGTTSVHPLGSADDKIIMVPLWEERVSPGLEQMVRSVHNYDVKFGVQLLHVGLIRAHQTMCPSVIPEMARVGRGTREMSQDEIKECVEAFGAAAKRCVRAGFDFVEIHGTHGALISEFLTPYCNRRTDEYGGSFDNRIRFLLEVIHAVRDEVGDEIPVGVRVNGDDYLKEGAWTLSELCRLAPILERESINYLSVSIGFEPFDLLRYTVAPMYEDQGFFVQLSEEVKKHVSIPVVVAGRIKSPIMADRIIMEGKADLVAMGRAQIADPEMVEKARRGEIAEIRPCLADCHCISGLFEQGELTCSVNPRLGREYFIRDIEGEKRASAKKVLVAGAGCAGLEAARRAAFAGHKVILCESRGWIGGQLRLAANMPKRQEIGDIIPWYERQLNRLGVEIRLNTPVDEALLEQVSPDVLVVATGSLPEVPLGFIEGLANVQDIELLLVDELVEEERLTGDNVLVIGGDQIGLQIADYLSERGKKTYVVEKGAHFAEKMAHPDRFYLIERIINKGVKRYKNVLGIEILPTDEVWMVNDGGKERLPEIDTIVLASDRRPNIFLAEVAERKGIETRIIGDAKGVAGTDRGTVLAAIATGYEAGRQI